MPRAADAVDQRPRSESAWRPTAVKTVRTSQRCVAAPRVRLRQGALVASGCILIAFATSNLPVGVATRTRAAQALQGHPRRDQLFVHAERARDMASAPHARERSEGSNGSGRQGDRPLQGEGRRPQPSCTAGLPGDWPLHCIEQPGPRHRERARPRADRESKPASSAMIGLVRGRGRTQDALWRLLSPRSRASRAEAGPREISISSAARPCKLRSLHRARHSLRTRRSEIYVARACRGSVSS